jgi:hypothetical protein
VTADDAVAPVAMLVAWIGYQLLVRLGPKRPAPTPAVVPEQPKLEQPRAVPAPRWHDEFDHPA